MFIYDPNDGSITMHQGDTGSYMVTASRRSGEPFSENDRMLFTISNGTEALIQRIYRLDREDIGNGNVLIEFHNEDTDDIPTGNYMLERRYIINPYWDVDEGGAIPTENVADALTASARIIDGDIVRVPEHGQATLQITNIYGEV